MPPSSFFNIIVIYNTALACFSASFIFLADYIRIICRLPGWPSLSSAAHVRHALAATVSANGALAISCRAAFSLGIFITPLAHGHFAAQAIRRRLLLALDSFIRPDYICLIAGISGICVATPLDASVSFLLPPAPGHACRRQPPEGKIIEVVTGMLFHSPSYASSASARYRVAPARVCARVLTPRALAFQPPPHFSPRSPAIIGHSLGEFDDWLFSHELFLFSTRALPAKTLARLHSAAANAGKHAHAPLVASEDAQRPEDEARMSLSTPCLARSRGRRPRCPHAALNLLHC